MGSKSTELETTNIEKTVVESIFNIIGKNKNLTAAQITPGKYLKHDLGADSLDLFEIFLTLEKKFNIVAHISELRDKIDTVKDIIDFLINEIRENEL